MPSKKSKTLSKNPSSLWRDELDCSEQRIFQIAREFAAELQPGDRVLLEGPIGVGKTTFAKAVLQGLGVDQPPEGSPTFAIAHEYQSPTAEVVHLDLYRIKCEEELDEAGIPAYFWERRAIVLVEWLSLFPEFSAAVHRSRLSQTHLWEVTLSFDKTQRAIRIVKQQE